MKTVAIPFLLATAVLAGCVSTQDDGTNNPTTGAPLPVAFGPMKIVGEGARSVSEPFVLADNDGRLFVCGPSADYSLLWMSEDNGTTWKVLDPNSAPGAQGGGDCSLAVGPDGSIYMTDLWIGSNSVSSSHDHGKTWFTTPLSGQAVYFDREWNTVMSNGNAYLLARQFEPGATTWVSESTDGGRTWVTVGRAWDDPRPGGTTFGTLDPNQNGPFIWNPARNELAVVYSCNADYKTICLSVSKDRARNWVSHQVIHRDVSIFHIFPVVAVDTLGNYYVAWSEGQGSTDIYYSHSADGVTWTPPLKINKAAGNNLMPWIVAGDAGRIAVVWYATNTTGDNNDATAMKDAKWTVEYAQSLDALEPDPAWEQATASPGFIHNGTVSTRGFDPTDRTSPPDRILGDFLSVAVDPWGFSHVSFCKGSRNPNAGSLLQPPPPNPDPRKTGYVHQESGPSLYANPPAKVWL